MKSLSINQHNSSKIRTIFSIALIQILLTTKLPLYAQNVENTFYHTAHMNHGINISLLENITSTNTLPQLNDLTFRLHTCIRYGFRTIRLPVAFDAWLQKDKHFFTPELWRLLDRAVKIACKDSNKLIISYHRGVLSNDNYSLESVRISRMWSQIAKRYSHVSNFHLYLEPYNEPVMDEWRWQHAFGLITDSIRQWNQDRVLIYGATNYNSIYELSRITPLAIPGIIYTFHFYEPFLFTHQGASWAGKQCATTGLPFPYNEQHMPPMNIMVKNTWGEHRYYTYPQEATDSAVYHKIQIVANWASQNKTAIICGEFGSHKAYADADSRCKYTTTVLAALNHYYIPGLYWDFDKEFGIYTEGEFLPCYRNLFNLKKR